MSTPELSVVVASHDRPLRLRWLLNALAEQTLERGRWEAIVCHDSAGPDTEAVLTEHPLAADGVLRHRRFEPGSAAASIKRNAGVELARAPTVVFTDDDCRPPAGWLAAVLTAVQAHPGAAVQGPMAPDPDEATMLRSPFPRSVAFADVPRVWAESCNIAYPTALLRSLGGFAEDLHVGEDTDLCLRAQAAGAPFVGVAEMLSHHAVDEGVMWDRVSAARRWSDLPTLFARQPSLRAELFLGVFWKREHALALVALLGIAASAPSASTSASPISIVRRAAALAAVLPWALARSDHGTDVRGRLRQLAALPAWALIDGAEVAVLAKASAAARTLVL